MSDTPFRRHVEPDKAPPDDTRRTGDAASGPDGKTGMDPGHENRPINRFLVHKPLSYGKKFYFGEFVAERSIQAIAFLSIAFILAIFYYVFQESTYAFRSFADTQGAATKTVPLQGSGADSARGRAPAMAPESYGSEPENLKPESYGSEPENLKPESYGSEPQNLKPESYGGEETKGKNTPSGGSAEPVSSLEQDRAKSRGMETAGTERTVSVRGLLTPNDTTGGVRRYIWQPISGIAKYSLIPLFLGALKVTLIAVLLAAPIAIFSAIFTTTFAPRWMREVMKPAIEILAGFPSVVIGFFCLITLASIIQSVTGSDYRLNAFVGGVGMSLAVIPIIFTVAEDALTSVPKYMKEASLALGASRWQTAWRVVLPAATPGVFAAIILGFGRAFGETMIALMATGNAALVSADIFESVRTMSATIGAEMAEVEFHSVHYGVLFLIGAILFVITFTLNAVAEFYVRKRLIKRFQGK